MARIYNQKTGLYEDDTLDGTIDKKAVNDYLMQKYNLNSLGDDLKNAQQAQREDTAVANQAQGFSQIAAAIGGVKNSDEFYNQLRNQAKQSVVDVQDATKAKMQALDNEQQINKAQREADMFDPNSKASVSFRKTIEANFPNVAKAYGDSWQNVSSGDQESIFRPLQLKENIEARKQEQAMRRQDRADLQGIKYQEKDDKKKAVMFEVEDRYRNIKDSIKNLKGMVDKYGTQELFGPENKQMDQYITSIATDMAKLVDPSSVARESEVASFKKMLFEPTMFMRDSTAKGVIDNFDKMLDSRLGNAYQVRGLEVPTKRNTERSEQARTNKPKQIKQNGHTYILNESTGEYE